MIPTLREVIAADGGVETPEALAEIERRKAKRAAT